MLAGRPAPSLVPEAGNQSVLSALPVLGLRAISRLRCPNPFVCQRHQLLRPGMERLVPWEVGAAAQGLRQLLKVGDEKDLGATGFSFLLDGQEAEVPSRAVPWVIQILASSTEPGTWAEGPGLPLADAGRAPPTSVVQRPGSRSPGGSRRAVRAEEEQAMQSRAGNPPGWSRGDFGPLAAPSRP